MQYPLERKFYGWELAASKRIARMSLEAVGLLLLTLAHVDSDGIISGEPLLLLATVCPLRTIELYTKFDGIVSEWETEEIVERRENAEGDKFLYFKQTFGDVAIDPYAD